MKLVFATGNIHKIKEIQALMPSEIQLLSLNDINCHDDIVENANTIAGNALLKAQFIKENYGYDCFADDTGLEVMALKGAPGIYSARYAGPQKNALDNTQKLLLELKNKENRAAQFKTVIALAIANQFFTFEGICQGEITISPRGNLGFGYDPVFQPKGYTSTFAQMTPALKNKIGHRGKAVQKLIHYLKTP